MNICSQDVLNSFFDVGRAMACAVAFPYWLRNRCLGKGQSGKSLLLGTCKNFFTSLGKDFFLEGLTFDYSHAIINS